MRPALVLRIGTLKVTKTRTQIQTTTPEFAEGRVENRQKTGGFSGNHGRDNVYLLEEIIVGSCTA
jgi:hypothetical protein